MRVRPLVLSLVALLSLTACSSAPPRVSHPSGKGAAGADRVVPDSSRETGRHRSSGGLSVTLASHRLGATDHLAGDYADHPSVQAFIVRMQREHGFDPAYLTGVFSGAQRQQWILNFVNRPRVHGPSVPTGAWTRYRAKFLTEHNIDAGVDFWRRYRSALDRAYARYGVPPEYIVAILGVETHYGSYMGKPRVLDALTTLAFDYPRRAEYFTGELEAFLLMVREEGMDPFQPVGSYAGAMGLAQFMPSSFRRFAVDFDGDGKRNLWSPVDAIGSVANYFASHGWKRGELVAVRADVRGSAPHAMQADYKTRYPLDVLRGRGIRSSLAGNGEVSLLRLDARGGYQYWLGLSNFYVITRYNHSTYYAMAVHQLAQAIRARHGPWPAPTLTQEAPPLSSSGPRG
ncbi:MAG: lytic murein transglycosylase B [Chromatiaceae bacterium]